MVKKYLQFINEADAPAPAPAPPADQAPTELPSQAETSPAQPQASGTTQGEQPSQPAPQGQGEQKSGDLSNYANEEVTKFPDTVKKMVDLLKDMDKGQLVKIRNLIAELKSINDAKSEIGKL